jgi:hypothetical protein
LRQNSVGHNPLLFESTNRLIEKLALVRRPAKPHLQNVASAGSKTE